MQSGALTTSPPPAVRAGGLALALAVGVVALLAIASVLVGAGDLTPGALLAGDGQAMQLLLASRIPRTLAIVLAGTAMAVSGMIMQMLLRNRFVEPSTAGTAESASLGILTTILVAPAMPLVGKMAVAAIFALAGTAIFLAILRRLPLRSVLIVPLVGLMLGGVVEATTTFLAFRYDLLQSLAAWTTGDFSAVLRGRYEMLWICFALTLAAYAAADRFTVAGLGQSFSTNLGLNHRRILSLGLVIVSTVTAVVVVTVGTIPFLGLIVPNLVSMTIGDNVRRAVPWVAVSGAGLLLACDLIGRLVRQPYEIPVGTVMGVVGSAAFLALLLKRGTRFG
ncbi:ABC transporter permease [Arenibaculum pallidiluteum]|uniref:ABC transporter permease n=1 Tax=Arenibaculum pallidiluteum TaxID=2812559 RepID=UPI001F1DCC5C|nr:iron chelate uptake ABC transporter family permease subunit [Arenibaculum pallidiluteum]